jgi:hypothetical protein
VKGKATHVTHASPVSPLFPISSINCPLANNALLRIDASSFYFLLGSNGIMLADNSELRNENGIA